MVIGGFTPFTLTDYPGEIAAICFTQGCNFSCPFCHNKPLIPRDKTGPANKASEKVLAFVKNRKDKLTGLVISGGEPTIQPDLFSFLETVKALGTRVKLDTNGSNPKVLLKLLKQGFIDMVAMDIKAPWSKYFLLAGCTVNTDNVKASIDIILGSGIKHVFRTTFVPGLLDHEDLDEIRTYLPSGARYVVQRYKKPAKTET